MSVWYACIGLEIKLAVCNDLFRNGSEFIATATDKVRRAKVVRTTEDAIEDVLQRRRPEARLHLEAHMRHARGRPASMHQNVAPVVKLRRDLLSSLQLNFSDSAQRLKLN